MPPNSWVKCAIKSAPSSLFIQVSFSKLISCSGGNFDISVVNMLRVRILKHWNPRRIMIMNKTVEIPTLTRNCPYCPRSDATPSESKLSHTACMPSDLILMLINTTQLCFWGASRRWLVGQRLDSKSKLCPNIVQYTSKVCPIPVKVQGLSSPCPTISTHVQTLSNVCQDPVQTKFFGQTLDAKI